MVKTIVCSDPEGAQIYDIWKTDTDSNIIILGDIMDSTHQSLDDACYKNYKKYNIRNLLFIREMELFNKCTVLLGNRDLMKLKLTLLYFDKQEITDINSYDTLINYVNDNYNKSKQLNDPHYLLNLNESAATNFLTKFVDIDKKRYTWYELFRLFFDTVGALPLLDSIYSEILDICPTDFTNKIKIMEETKQKTISHV